MKFIPSPAKQKTNQNRKESEVIYYLNNWNYIRFFLLEQQEEMKMSIYILEDFIKVCKVLGVEPTWERLHKWRSEMWQD